MQGRQISTTFRHFPTNRTPFLKNFVGGTNKALIFCLSVTFFVTVKVAKGNKKVPQNIDFVGLVFSLSPFWLFFW